jgi:hypothetical protein
MPNFGDERLPERFWSKVLNHPATGCWEWQASRFWTGYGRFWVNPRTRSTHRVAYEALVGLIPPGHDIDHLCRNKNCCNPAHLEPVTQRENTLRAESPPALNAIKTQCTQGHAFDTMNTRTRRDGSRTCLICERTTRTARAFKELGPCAACGVSPRALTSAGFGVYCRPCDASRAAKRRRDSKPAPALDS